MIWDTHCNSPHTRWILRNHGITLTGPQVTDLVDAVPSQALRESMREMLPGLIADLRIWARARETLATRWRPLLTQVIQDRELGWDPTDPPRPGSLEAMYAFGAYAESFAS
ncbi:hypothetical protein [Streptomyces sp. NPDC003943]